MTSPQETQSPRTSGLANAYRTETRKVELGEKAVYPSCSRALAVLPRNVNDPNKYYEELGVYPWSTDKEIRDAYYKLAKKYHPDAGWEPDPHRFKRIAWIYGILSNPKKKRMYDSIPEGEMMIDEWVRQDPNFDMRNAKFDEPEEKSHYGDDLDVRTTGEVDDDLRYLLEGEEDHEDVDLYYDYMADRQIDEDIWLAHRWYNCLLKVAPAAQYKRTIKVLLHDGPPAFAKLGGVMMIPRTWEPSEANAYALFVHVARTLHKPIRRF